jgi:hypothetical protein
MARAYLRPFCPENVGIDTHRITFGIDKHLGLLMSPEGGAWRKNKALSTSSGLFV